MVINSFWLGLYYKLSILNKKNLYQYCLGVQVYILRSSSPNHLIWSKIHKYEQY